LPLARKLAIAAEVFMNNAGSLDSFQTGEYDDSSYDPVGTRHHTDRENRTMASVCSYYGTSFHSSSDRHDQLTLSPPVNHGFDSSLTATLIRRLIARTAKPCIRNAPHPFMEPRRMTPTGP
jgi:hypothetical protein